MGLGSFCVGSVMVGNVDVVELEFLHEIFTVAAAVEGSYTRMIYL
jgi:hypothetical protein